MLAIYQITTEEINKRLIADIKQRFHKDEKLIITVKSEKDLTPGNKVLEFLELEKKFPLKSVPQSLDFNETIDEINL